MRATQDAKDHYEKAIRLLARKDPGKTVEIYLEYWGKYLSVMEPEVQMSLARRLVHDRRFDFCAKTLEVLIQDFPGEGPFMEKAFLMLARLYGQKLDAPRKAANVYEQFLKTFPHSPWMGVARREYEEIKRKWNAWEKGATEKDVATSCSCS